MHEKRSLYRSLELLFTACRYASSAHLLAHVIAHTCSNKLKYCTVTCINKKRFPFVRISKKSIARAQAESAYLAMV